MKIGDAVRFIGFKEYRTKHTFIDVGIVIAWKMFSTSGEKRYDVIWPNGVIGQGLFEETLELVNECR